MKTEKKEKEFKAVKLRDSQGSVSHPLAAVCRKYIVVCKPPKRTK